MEDNIEFSELSIEAANIVSALHTDEFKLDTEELPENDGMQEGFRSALGGMGI